ncbi:MAG: M23 family metallopeptidase [Chlorobiales bacterium]|nr:M23 family metallopeptidase [Chlorobiales bacterium]
MGSRRKKKMYTLSLIPVGGRSRPVTLLRGSPAVFVLVPFLVLAVLGSLIALLFFSTPLRYMVPGWTLSGHQEQLVALQAKRVDSLLVEIESMRAFSEKVEGVMFQEEAMVQGGESPGGSGRRVFGSGIMPPLFSADSAETGGFTGRLITGSISQRFKPGRSHYGVDIATSRNEPVGAVADGSVIFADWTGAFGYTLIVDHGEYMTFYKHCSKLLKKGGEQVKLGEVIALAGNTGQESSGVHLHFEVWRNGIPVNPETYLNFSM